MGKMPSGVAEVEVVGPVDAAAALSRNILVALEAVPAGFPSPAQDHYRGPIDLNEHLILDRTSTFIVRVAGDSMTGAGIFDGDELLVDRSLDAGEGDVVVAIVDGELTVKRLARSSGGLMLRAENPRYPSIPLVGEQEMIVWGVVTHNIHRHRP